MGEGKVLSPAKSDIWERYLHRETGTVNGTQNSTEFQCKTDQWPKENRSPEGALLERLGVLPLFQLLVPNHQHVQVVPVAGALPHTRTFRICMRR